MTSDEARKVFAWIEDYTDGDPVSFTHDEVRRMRDAMSLMFAGDSSDVRVRAKELRMIVERFFHGAQTSEHMYAMLESLERRATTALLSAARVPEGCVREGVTDMRLIGKLPMTADGCVCGAGGKVYVNSMVQKQVIECEVRDGRFGWLTSPLCYSTRDAAIAARKEGAKDE